MTQSVQVDLQKKDARLLVGEVVSDKMDKTVVVKVSRTFKHPLFGKIMRSHKKYHVHDENNVAKNGDWVEIKESRPISKTKHMALIRVLEKH
jgi:small subunit ribosomal protein S17